LSNALSKIAETFDALAANPRGLSVTELAQLLHTSKSSSSRLLASLVEAGLVDRDTGQRHFLNVRFWTWGIQAVRRLAVLDVARPHITAAVKSLSVSVFVAIARGDQTIYLECITKRNGDVLSELVSYVVPIYACAPGKAILAFSPEPAVEAVLAGPLVRFTQHTRATRAELEDELESVRRRGYALNRGEHYDNGRLAIAAPVFDQTRLPVAAICFFGFTDQESTEAMVPHLLSLTETVSASLGFSRALQELLG
jgi:DNA-binding IclR family transcriptional regulator